jgi:hypothetical protein
LAVDGCGLTVEGCECQWVGLVQKKRASIEIQPVFKIQYPMKNRCKYRDQNHYSYNLFVVFLTSFFSSYATN